MKKEAGSVRAQRVIMQGHTGWLAWQVERGRWMVQSVPPGDGTWDRWEVFSSEQPGSTKLKLSCLTVNFSFY